ncbi:MAG: HAD-IIIA family hydrolase [Bernardetiaceae bacterium]|nr:HAD-IIIA family hydrolase [Bernardetiaceae bacterium]
MNNKHKASVVKVIISDVDGVLTDGGIIYDSQGNESKRFHVRDGLMMKHIQSLGFKVGVITGRDSSVVRKRCEELGLAFHYHGIKDKIQCYEKIKATYNFSDVEVAYIGDDWNDLSLLQRVGFSAAPVDAAEAVRKSVDFLLHSKGGEGAFRELAEYILKSQNQYETLLNNFFKP